MVLFHYRGFFLPFLLSLSTFYFSDEGVYVDTYGKISKNVVLQWGELPTSVAYISLSSSDVSCVKRRHMLH